MRVIVIPLQRIYKNHFFRKIYFHGFLFTSANSTSVFVQDAQTKSDNIELRSLKSISALRNKYRSKLI